MNKKYIKRQITLYKLGLNISEDIKDYYNRFKDAFVNIEVVKDNDFKTVWYKDKKLFMVYYKNSSRIWICRSWGNMDSYVPLLEMELGIVVKELRLKEWI